MNQHRPVRVIKRDRKGLTESPSEASGGGRAEPSERELKTVVSGWVREHRQRSEEFRRTFARVLAEAGFPPPSRAASRA